MNLKLDFKIALKYSLFYSVFLLLLKINDHLSLDKNYFTTATPFSFVAYLSPVFFAFLLVKAYLEYLKYGKNYKDLIVISFFVLFLSDLFSYIINFSFFKLFYENIYVPRGEGILGILNQPFAISEPRFDYFFGAIFTPVQYLFNALVHGEFLQVFYIVTFNRLFILLFVLYFFNLFFLFKKYDKNKWYSLVPVLNKLTLIKIAEKPVFWIIPVFIPFIGYFMMYFINKEIAEENGFDSKLALGMTFLPSVFYGKISFNENPIPVDA